MDKDQQRIAIAESLGWERVGRNGWMKGGQSGTMAILPDYLNDLNACHEFEKTLTDDEWASYTCMLGLVIDKNNQLDGAELEIKMVHAQSSQRCETYIRIKGLWRCEENQEAIPNETNENLQPHNKAKADALREARNEILKAAVDIRVTEENLVGYNQSMGIIHDMIKKLEGDS